MKRNEWIEAGARVIVKRAVRIGFSIARPGLENSVTNAPFDLILDLARTTYRKHFDDVVNEWGRQGEMMVREYVGTHMVEKIMDGRRMKLQAKRALEMILDQDGIL